MFCPRVKQKRKTFVFLSWERRESNPRHKDFQSFALPTELRSRFICECKYTNNIKTKTFCDFFLKITTFDL